AADEAGITDRRHDRRLDTAHVGDDATPAQGGARLVSDRTDWRGDERDVGFRVVAHVVQRAQFDRPGRTRFVEVSPGDAPPLRPKGETDGTPDQAGADNEGPTFGAHR